MRWLPIWLGLSILSISSPAYPHGGGLDQYGCHHNRKHGGYHCHRGVFRGSMFDSKAEMLQVLEQSAPAIEFPDPLPMPPLFGALILEPREVTVATWNIEWLNARWDQGRVKRDLNDLTVLNNFARLLDADVVALQEVDGPEAAGWVFPPHEYEYHFSSRDYVARVGFAIRKGIAWQANPDYTALEVGLVPRGVDITLFPNTMPIRLLAVHLKSGCFEAGPMTGESEACRVLGRQLPVLEQWIDARAREGMPFFVLGDFNRQLNHDNDAFWAEIDDGEPPNAHLTNFTVGHINECHQRRYPRFIDHIVSDKLAVELVAEGSFRQVVYTPQLAKKYKLSDHCPISVKIRID